MAPVRPSWLSGLVVICSLVLVGGAQAQPALSSSSGHQTADPIVGDWSWNEGVVRVSGSGTSFAGVVVRQLKLYKCTHPVGEVVWQITKSGSDYVGTHQFFDGDTGSCVPGSGGAGRADWSLKSHQTLYMCTTYTEMDSFNRCSEFSRVNPVKPPAPKPKPPAPKPKPVKPPSKPQAQSGWLELTIDLKPAAAKSPLFRICLTKPGSERILCFKLRKDQPLAIKNHGKTVQWPVGTKLQVCEDERAGWITPGCQTITIKKGLNRKTVVNRQDTSPPEVKAFDHGGYISPGEKIALQLRVKDDSGKAKVHNTVYQGGKRIGSAATPFIAANGKRVSWNATVPANLVGPLYFCLWAEDGAGNRSAHDNKTNEFESYNGSCAWIPLVAPIAKVSNTCGGEGWAAFVAVQRYFGNEHTYSNSNKNPLAASYPVSFAEACNLHDAGYGGYAVYDTINSRTINYRNWTRKMVDDKFLDDLRKLCTKRIPSDATVALKNCKARGGNASIGAEYLFNLVHKIGWRFFDTDLTKPGLQKTGHRPNFD